MSRAKNRSDARRMMRRRLEARGWSRSAIEAYVQDMDRRANEQYEAARRRERLAAQEADLLTKPVPTEWQPPNDKNYKPAQVDPVLVGVARATGQTAEAVKRGRSVTRAQWQRREERTA